MWKISYIRSNNKRDKKWSAEIFYNGKKVFRKYFQNEEDAIIARLQEEIKYSSAKITYLGCYYSSPGFTNELVHLYLAEDLFKSSLNEDEDEFIEISRYNIKQIKRLLTSNTITDMKTALGLMMYLNSKNDQSN